MTEENYILQKCGRENHFQVPEGYFEKVSTDIMALIRAKSEKSDIGLAKHKSLFRILRPYIAVAACVAAVVFSINVYFMKNTSQTGTQVAQYYDSYIDEVSDYAMLDNGDLYACMTDE